MVIDDHINLMGGNPLVGAERRTLRPAVSGHDGRLFAAAARASPTKPRGASGTDAAARRLRRRCSDPATRRRPRSAIFGRSAPMPSACRRCPKRSPRGIWGSRCSGISCITNMAAGRPAAAARSRRSDGDGTPRARAVHRAAGGHHWPALTTGSLVDCARAARAREQRQRRLLGLQGRRRARDRRRHHHYRLQRRERDLRPDHLRRARRDVQGALGGPSPLHPHRRRRRHRSADAAVRRLPADSVGVRRRPRDSSSPTSPRRKGPYRLKDLLPLPFDAGCSEIAN